MYYEGIDNAKIYIDNRDSETMKITRRDSDYLTLFTGNLNQQPIIILKFEIENDFIEVELPPGVTN